MTLFANRTMTPKSPAKRYGNGLKTVTLQSPSGLHSLQTLVPLNTFGIILREFEEPASSVGELWDRVQKLWEEILKEECQKLIESMPRRLATMIKAKGGYTKY